MLYQNFNDIMTKLVINCILKTDIFHTVNRQNMYRHCPKTKYVQTLSQNKICTGTVPKQNKDRHCPKTKYVQTLSQNILNLHIVQIPTCLGFWARYCRDLEYFGTVFTVSFILIFTRFFTKKIQITAEPILCCYKIVTLFCYMCIMNMSSRCLWSLN